MDPLYKKAIAQGVAGMAVFVAFIFLPAGTWHYWQGCLFIAVFSVSTIGFTVYLAPHLGIRIATIALAITIKKKIMSALAASEARSR
jgi:hypothetical protein